MVRWLIHENDFEFCAENEVHPYFKHMTSLSQKGFDQPPWLGVTDIALRAFMMAANVDPARITMENLKDVQKALRETEVPMPLIRSVAEQLQKMKGGASAFSLETLIISAQETPFQWPWDPWTECTSLQEEGTSTFEGFSANIKNIWLSLINEKVLHFLFTRGLNFSHLRIFILIRPHVQTLMSGELLSYNPRSLWDPRVFVVSFKNGSDEAAYLIERGTCKATYYGKKPEVASSPLRSVLKDKNKNKMEANLLSESQIRLLAQFLQDCEAKLNLSLRIKWVFDENGRILVLRMEEFSEAPSREFFNRHHNTQTRHVWDHSLFHWSPEKAVEPLWFSLVPRNLRLIAIRYSGALGMKGRLSADYERVFRGLVGILRGRPYLNVGAFHRFLILGGNDELASEIEFLVPQWLQRFDREMCDSWDSVWPKPLSLNSSDKKALQKKNAQFRKKLSKQLKAWNEQMHQLREALSSQQLKTQDIPSLLYQFQNWERKFIPSLVPILMAELQYWNYRSWYYQLLDQKSELPSWNDHYKQEPLKIEGGWFMRRRLEKQYLEMENLREIRPKYLATLGDVWSKLQRFFELVGQKYQALGMLKNFKDIYFLTFEELLAFEEGRAAIIDWDEIIRVRKNEYQKYLRDEQVPETWVTKGLIALASRYPKIIALKEKYNPLMATDVGAKISASVPREMIREDGVAFEAARMDSAEVVKSRAERKKTLFLLKNKKFKESALDRVEGLGEIGFIDNDNNTALSNGNGDRVNAKDKTSSVKDSPTETSSDLSEGTLSHGAIKDEANSNGV